MNSKKVEKILIKRGYKLEKLNGFDSETVVANYYQVMWQVANLPHCLTNDRPPQIYLKEYVYKTERSFSSFEVGITNRSPQGWINIRFYSIDEKELIEKLDTFEKALLESWRNLFEIEKTEKKINE